MKMQAIRMKAKQVIRVKVLVQAVRRMITSRRIKVKAKQATRVKVLVQVVRKMIATP